MDGHPADIDYLIVICPPNKTWMLVIDRWSIDGCMFDG